MYLNAAGQRDGINLPLRTRKNPISEPGLALPEGGGRFRRQEHLKRRVEVTRVFKKGRVVNCPGAKLFFFANNLPYNRIVITFARKFGNAVQRNRARRLGREAYRLIRENCKTGYDLVLLLYPRPKESDSSKTALKGAPKGEKNPTVKAAARTGSLAESAEQLQTLFKKAKLWLPQCRNDEEL